MIKKEFRYVEMASILRTEILTGRLKPGKFLLPEKELCQLYNISRNSLRQALEVLTKEGLLVKMVGRGTMVSKEIDLQHGGANVLNIVCPGTSSFVDKALPILIEMFNEKHPNVEVRKFGTGSNNDRLLQELSEFGVNADLVIVRDQDIQRLPLDDFLTIEDIVKEHSSIQNKLLNLFCHKNKCYGMPLTFSPIFLAANPHLFADSDVKLPNGSWTIDEFVEAAKRINRDTNGDGLTDVYGFGFSNSLFRWPVLAMKYGYLLKFDHSKADQDKLVDVLTFLQNLVYRDKVSPIMEVINWPVLGELFEESRLGMVLTTTLSTNMKLDRFPVTVLPMPEGPGAISGGLSIANGIVIPKISDNPELAKLFVRSALSPEFQLRMAREAGFLSVYTDVNNRVWTRQQLSSMGSEPEQLERTYFINELLQNPHAQHLLEAEMIRYWSGFETPIELAGRMVKKFK